MTGANRLRDSDRRLLSHAALAALDEAGDRGIFVLTRAELERVGTLNDAEQSVVRQIINTRDVFPYACRPDPNGTVMLYLPEPEGPEAEEGQDPTPPLTFTDDMPSLAAHLERFKPVLEDKVRRYNERRQWWTIHRGRPGIRAAEGTHPRWAGYALTARWGVGERLLVGLAPRGVAPESGLHALLPSTGVDAAYLVAMLNSSPVQALADALAPGQLRTEDVFGLGLPILPEEDVAVIRACGLSLAEIVDLLIALHTTRWPLLADALRADLTLAVLPTDSWTPAPGPATRWGPLRAVRWTSEIVPAQPPRQPIREVQLTETLFGLQAVVSGRGAGTVAVDLAERDVELANALVAMLRGAGATGADLRALPDLLVPVDPRELIALHRDQAAELEREARRYHEERAVVDARLDALLQ